MKLQHEKSESHVLAQPKHFSGIIQLIIGYDLCGWKVNKIAEAVKLTPSRVSVIINSPLYKGQREDRRKEFMEQLVDKKTDEIVAGDPIEHRIKQLATKAIEVKGILLENSGSDFVRNSVASDLLDRAGYKPEVKKTITSIEVTEKMAGRFERILSNGRDQDAGEGKIRIKTEVSE